MTETSNSISMASRDQNRQPLIRVIGIGSHHGADVTGWLACDRLQATANMKHFDWHFCRTPAQLPHLVQDCGAVIIVDAILSDNPAAQIVSLSWPVPHARYHSLCSSHDISVIEALRLASTLGQLPLHTYLLGLTVTDRHQDATAVITKVLPQLREQLKRIHECIISTGKP